MHGGIKHCLHRSHYLLRVMNRKGIIKKSVVREESGALQNITGRSGGPSKAPHSEEIGGNRSHQDRVSQRGDLKAKVTVIQRAGSHEFNEGKEPDFGYEKVNETEPYREK